MESRTKVTSPDEVLTSVSHNHNVVGFVPMYVANQYGGDSNNLDIYLDAYRTYERKMPFKILCAVYTSKKPKRGFHILCHLLREVSIAQSDGENRIYVFRVRDTVNGSMFEACAGNDYHSFRERFTLATPKMISPEEIYFGAECLSQNNSTQRGGVNREFAEVLFTSVYPVFFSYKKGV